MTKTSSDVAERGTTAKVKEADGSVARQGETQKDSNAHHDDLLAACRDGNMAEVKRVLDLGQVDVNCRGEWSQTPVMEPSRCRHREVVELLLSRGADVSLVDKDGDNTLHWACIVRHVRTVELILSQDVVDVNCRGGGRSRTPVMEAAAGWGQRDVVELLLSRGADLSLMDKDGDNTLHWSCEGGDVGMVELIQSQDVLDVNCREVRSWTPVMRAALGGHRDVAEHLLSRGADVSLVDMEGNNILHWACVGANVGLVELILSLNVVDINTRNKNGEASANWPRVYRHHQPMELLESRGAR
ncbi:histone-lysine N-methyltransferase EHMT2-like isoform X2 [Haliotis rubra]|uniref:histone-lysine N-methyltransferase EHMT2-like isoform X2 n=1 Tax=Haliotis rubra TaxID=36100 RepID=UPI001EE53F43|nr:histone-lysine N-methyltransferase EHMT2-like isoform X2 [Haliotis rubra]